MIYARIIAAIAIALALAGIYWKGYTNGKKAVHAEWDAEKIIVQKAALDAQAENAAKAAAARKQVERIDRDLQTARKERDAYAATAADSVRRLNAALGGESGTETSAASGTDDDPTYSILRQCASVVRSLGQEVRGLADQAAGLQRYASEVCLK